MQPLPITVSTFYHFTPLPEPRALKPRLLEAMQQLGIKGTITLAPEGLNATISGVANAVENYLHFLRSMPMFSGLKTRESAFVAQPFQRSKVKVKRELISLGAEANPSLCVGTYVSPRDWNALISRPDVITIDTRNDYEFAIGHFQHAINPATRNFKEMVAFTANTLSPRTHPQVAMYCTGGIRCEKYSAYLLTQGFEHVYHLEGGILAYLENIPASESLWQGDCYVFDERVAVGHGLIKNPHYTMCRACGGPVRDTTPCACGR